MRIVAFEKVAEYQHPDVIERLQRTGALDRPQAVQLFQDTKQFLYLCAKYPDPMIPTKAIDEGWHNFILFTEDYASFCTEMLGRFVHHRPTPPSKRVSENQQRLYQNTLRIAQSEFSSPLSQNWTASSPTCCASEDGGTTNCQDK